MPAAILGPVAGAVVGGMMGGDDQQSQTASKEPWAEAAPWLKDNIKTGQDLQRYYQQSPFNQPQQQGYQNLFSDIDNYRDNVSPGLMQIANKYLQRNGGQGMSLLNTAPQGQQGAQGQQGGAMAHGLLNFQNLNPFTSTTNGIPQPPPPQAPPPKTAAETAQEEWDRLVRTGEAYRGAGA